MNRRSDDFDRTFNGLRKLAVFWFILVGILSVGTTGFAIWVVYKLLQHFAIIA